MCIRNTVEYFFHKINFKITNLFCNECYTSIGPYINIYILNVNNNYRFKLIRTLCYIFPQRIIKTVSKPPENILKNISSSSKFVVRILTYNVINYITYFSTAITFLLLNKQHKILYNYSINK